MKTISQNITLLPYGPIQIALLCFFSFLSFAAEATEQAKSNQSRKVAGIRFELQHCKIAGKTVTCEMQAISEGKDREVTVLGSSAVIFTDNGDSYPGSTVSIGNTSGDKVVRALIEGIPTPVRITFNKVSSSVQAVALLKVNLYEATAGFKTVEFRMIPISG